MKTTLSKGHVKWVLKHLLELRAGELPFGKGGDMPFFTKGGTAQTSASFTDIAEDTGEVERRLNICGKDGLILKLYYTLGESYEYIALNLELSEEDVKKRKEKALNYITGKWPKSEVYKRYRSHHTKND